MHAASNDRSVVLGIDAAWTNHGTSGIALLIQEGPTWKCLAAASSYQEFCRLGEHSDLLGASEAIAGRIPHIISVDMPLAKIPITSRRACDNRISEAFGASGCAVHSPTADRPGAVGVRLMTMLFQAGYELAVCDSPVRPRQIIGVYPHVALLRLLRTQYRVPYKVARRRRYWPNADGRARMLNLSASLPSILDALGQRITNIALDVPRPGAPPSEFKGFKDALDARQ